MDASALLARLDNVHPRGNDEYLACCPHHGPISVSRKSLSITVKEDRILVHCFGGCSTEDVMKSLGLSEANLFNGNGVAPIRRTPIATYNYRDENGCLLYQTLRYDVDRRGKPGKDFVQRRPLPGNKWEYSIKGKVRYVLYKLPDLLNRMEKDPEGQVYVAAGEKDVDNIWKIGLMGTTNVCGEAAPWLNEYSEVLSGKDVVIIPDNDPAGLAHAMAVAGSLLIHDANSIRVLSLDVPLHGDVSDWMGSQAADEATVREELERLTYECPVYKRI